MKIYLANSYSAIFVNGFYFSSNHMNPLLSIVSEEELGAFHDTNVGKTNEVSPEAKAAHEKIHAFVQMYLNEAEILRKIAEGINTATQLEGEQLIELGKTIDELKKTIANRNILIDEMLSSDDFYPEFKKFLKKNRDECNDNVNHIEEVFKQWKLRDDAIREIQDTPQ